MNQINARPFAVKREMKCLVRAPTVDCLRSYSPTVFRNELLLSRINPVFLSHPMYSFLQCSMHELSFGALMFLQKQMSCGCHGHEGC